MLFTGAAGGLQGDKAATDSNPIIQIALLLDTSDSASGLIEQAQRQIWLIVNEFASYRQYGKAPRLEVALLAYGNDSIPASDGHLQMLLPFTGDLDAVSNELANLSPQAGPKYCGMVIQQAVDTLIWSGSPDDLQVIFIIGNDPFYHGPIDYRSACEAAAAQGIIVNAVYCGDHQDGIANEWCNAAELTGGAYLSVDRFLNEDYIEAPQDKRIAELAVNLNSTYISYGWFGNDGLFNQNDQDDQAAACGPETMIRRAFVKASALYYHPDWDLVDAVNEGTVELDAIDYSDLPAKLQKMTPQQLEAYVDALNRQRNAIRRQILQMRQKRLIYLIDQGIDPDPARHDNLAAALIKIIRPQSINKSFILEEAVAPGN